MKLKKWKWMMSQKATISVDKKPLVIVLSRNYSTGLGLIRSLGSAGFVVHLVASARRRNSSSIASSSKYVMDSIEFLTPDIYGDEGKDITSYLVDFAKGSDRNMVLFPADDYTSMVVDMNRDVLKELYLLPNVGNLKNGEISYLMEKDVQGKLALETGMNRPYETVISLKDEITIPEDMVYPCFVKPLKSVDGEKTEMAVCATREELLNCLKGMQSQFAKRSVLVQEFLNIDKEYDVGGVCLGDKVYIPGVIEKTHVARHERGVTMAGRMVPCDVLGNQLEKVKDMLVRLNYTGMFDLEFNCVGDEIYFNEINFRSGGPHFFYYHNGVNLPAIFVKGITGMEQDENTEIKEFGKTFVYEKVAWEDHINGFMSKKELRETIDKADFTLLRNDDDPAPGKIFERKIRLSALKHRVLNIIKRK